MYTIKRNVTSYQTSFIFLPSEFQTAISDVKFWVQEYEKENGSFNNLAKFAIKMLNLSHSNEQLKVFLVQWV